MPYNVTVKRFNGSQVSSDSIIDGRTPKPGDLIRVKYGKVTVNAMVDIVVERTAYDWVTAVEVE